MTLSITTMLFIFLLVNYFASTLFDWRYAYTIFNETAVYISRTSNFMLDYDSHVYKFCMVAEDYYLVIKFNFICY